MSKSRSSIVGIAVLLGTSAAALAAGPTGNRQAIKIEHASVRAYTKIPVETGVQTGYVAIDDGAGRPFYWSWATGYVPRGWVTATEHFVVALAAGKVVWWRDDLTPPACRGRSCHQVAAVLVGESTGTFVAYGDPRNHSCYVALQGSTPLVVGNTFGSVPGAHYAAPVHKRGVLDITFTFRWTRRQVATETDVVSTHTRLINAITINVSRGKGPHQPAFAIRDKLTYPTLAPAMPTINRCPH